MENPIVQFMFIQLAKFGQLERETLRERIRSEMEEARGSYEQKSKRRFYNHLTL
jgi:DNA invertase Pin-like site-specific DNA recombinase